MREILVESGDDPYITKLGDSYYYARNNPEHTRIYIAKSETLRGIGHASLQLVWESEGMPYSKQVWAPELQILNDIPYIYFAGSDGQNENHRMYVLESSSSDPLDTYSMKGKIATEDDHWAIDGTALEVSNLNYFVWSGWEGDTDGQQNLYIAKMASPWELEGERVCISCPSHDWESRGMPINEGPQTLARNGRTFIIYSASASWTDDYCLGQLELVGSDPLDPASWQKSAESVFAKTTEIHGPGHASFIKDEEQKDLIAYHAARHSGAGWDRQVWLQPYEWNTDGSPNFGSPS